MWRGWQDWLISKIYNIHHTRTRLSIRFLSFVLAVFYRHPLSFTRSRCPFPPDAPLWSCMRRLLSFHLAPALSSAYQMKEIAHGGIIFVPRRDISTVSASETTITHTASTSGKLFAHRAPPARITTVRRRNSHARFFLAIKMHASDASYAGLHFRHGRKTSVTMCRRR